MRMVFLIFSFWLIRYRSIVLILSILLILVSLCKLLSTVDFSSTKPYSSKVVFSFSNFLLALVIKKALPIYGNFIIAFLFVCFLHSFIFFNIDIFLPNNYFLDFLPSKFLFSNLSSNSIPYSSFDFVLYCDI